MLEENKKIDFYNLTRSELVEILKTRFDASQFRATQLFEWVYRKRVVDCEAMSNITKELRKELADTFSFEKAIVKERHDSKDGSRKYLLEVSPDVFIECVYIKQLARITLCVSSQYGCAMGCAFCQTGTMGLKKNLSTGDIIRQVLTIVDDYPDSKILGTHLPVHNIVFMGMGEPLNNYDAVSKAIQILQDTAGFNMGGRKITVSTSGFVPGLERFAKDDLDVNLAISLSATCDEVRNKIMPINKRYPIKQLIETLHTIPLKNRRKLTISYVLLNGVNDTPTDMKRLLSLLHGLKAKVNLIPYNENDGLDFQAPPDDTVTAWLDRLVRAGIETTVRWSRGSDIKAACGQLAVKRNEEIENSLGKD